MLLLLLERPLKRKRHSACPLKASAAWRIFQGFTSRRRHPPWAIIPDGSNQMKIQP